MPADATFPERYGQRVEFVGDGASSTEEKHAEALVESLEAHLEGVHDT